VGIRLPKAKDELSMAVHAAASCLRPGGTLLVYGAKDEGVASAARRVEPLLGPVRTLGTGGHCRILAASRPERIVGLRATLQDWRLQGEIELLGRLEPWVSYPGIFAHGRLDEGTRLLLTRLPELRDGTRALDFGCGSGPIAAACALRAREDRVDISLDGLDVDAVALEALRENVPSARPLLADGLAAVAGSYDLILSNPPYHVGKAESTEALSAFVARAPGVLAPGGRIVLVAQQRLRIEAPMRAAFPTVRVLTDDGTYRIWEGTTS
jgi:16S rRNA (guanine1207-N2)-methyltransferase